LIASFTRKTAKDLTLSDGTFLPKNTYLLAPSLAISADPTIYPNADTFDGLRFYNLRQESPQNEHKYQLTTTDKHMMHFGAGRHACPGRWFASAELKLILVNLILQYDMKTKDGIRPKGILFQNQYMPNPMVPVLFKRREI
jgi:cytochrome P450